MSQLNQVIRLVRVARERETAQDFDSAETAWEAARRANDLVCFPVLEIGTTIPVASPQLDDLPPGWFLDEDAIPPATAVELVSRPSVSPEEIGEFFPLSLVERAAGLLTGILGLSGRKKTKPPIDLQDGPRPGIGSFLTTLISVAVSGRGEETIVVSPPSAEAETAVAFLHGDFQPAEPQTEGDRLRRDAFLADAEKYGTAHVLGSSMFDWMGE